MIKIKGKNSNLNHKLHSYILYFDDPKSFQKMFIILESSVNWLQLENTKIEQLLYNCLSEKKRPSVTNRVWTNDCIVIRNTSQREEDFFFQFLTSEFHHPAAVVNTNLDKHTHTHTLFNPNILDSSVHTHTALQHDPNLVMMNTRWLWHWP